MRKTWVFLLLLVSGVLFAQQAKYSTFYHQRASLFEKLPVFSEDIIFLGNSITNGGEWAELLNNKHVKNRGISGDICMGVYDRLEPILTGKPAKIFLLIGVNDISRNTSSDTIVAQIEMILDKIKSDSPQTKVYLQSVLPVNDCFGMFESATKQWQVIRPLNERLKETAQVKNICYIDLYSHLIEAGTDKLDVAYSNDGLHLMGEGYLKWIEIIKPYLEDED